MEYLGLRLIGALFVFLFVLSIMRIVVRPRPTLKSRLRPYTSLARSSFGHTPDLATLSKTAAGYTQSVPERLFRPLAESTVKAVLRIFGAAFDDAELSKKLRQAGVLLDVSETQRVYEFRVRQVTSAFAFAGLGIAGGLVSDLSGSIVLLFGFVGLFIGLSRRSSQLKERIDTRRDRMRVELYTLNQLLAIYLRTSGSPILATQRICDRGKGAVIDEMREALRLHARGMSASRAFGRIAELTPEPFAARTYKLLANGSERGADLGNGLLSLSDDLREARRTELKRRATKQQAAMLVPIIAILAPIMLLFIGAPLPSFLFLKS